MRYLSLSVSMLKSTNPSDAHVVVATPVAQISVVVDVIDVGNEPLLSSEY